jgi:hypothetical protein
LQLLLLRACERMIGLRMPVSCAGKQEEPPRLIALQQQRGRQPSLVPRPKYELLLLLLLLLQAISSTQAMS